MVIGALIILVGLMFLIGNVLDVNVWAFCWPVGLILLGVWLLLRPQLVGADVAVRQKLLGDIHRDGLWQVAKEIDLDMTRADIPVGETEIRVFSFVGDVDVFMPEGVGIAVSSTAFVTEARVLGQKRDGIMFSLHQASDDYETAERKIRLEVTSFVADIKIRRIAS
jgi:predicted membrane protein